MQAAAVVVAAGAGARMREVVAKPFLPIAGRALILRTLDALFAAPVIHEVVLVVAAAEMKRCASLLGADAALRNRRCLLAAGGATRQESARRGLARVGANFEVVMIHDGARPFVSAALIERCAAAALAKGAAVPGLPVRDTIKRVSSEGWIEATPERASLWEIQTPQAFRRSLIVAAHEHAQRSGMDATDDAMVVERMGQPVFVVEGERWNLKITVPEDLRLAELLLREDRGNA